MVAFLAVVRGISSKLLGKGFEIDHVDDDFWMVGVVDDGDVTRILMKDGLPEVEGSAELVRHREIVNANLASLTSDAIGFVTC